ncbi:MAG: hypothetical protein ACXWZM_10255 [Solirubrobacterales bacterium]
MAGADGSASNTPPRPARTRLDTSVLWRAALVQLLGVVVLSLLLAVLLPSSFFEDWGWIAGPLAWFACAALTAWVLHLELRGALLGALLAGLLSALAVVAGIHWLGLVVAVGAFAAWCAWLPFGGAALPWQRAGARV